MFSLASVILSMGVGVHHPQADTPSRRSLQRTVRILLEGTLDNIVINDFAAKILLVLAECSL